jgi:hypothetical protein
MTSNEKGLIKLWKFVKTLVPVLMMREQLRELLLEWSAPGAVVEHSVICQYLDCAHTAGYYDGEFYFCDRHAKLPTKPLLSTRALRTRTHKVLHED